MKKKTLINNIVALLICFLSLTGIGTVMAEEAGELDTVLSKLRDRFSSSKTFQADYIRELVPKIASKLPSSSFQAEGVLSFRSPNKLRMDQKKPRPEQLICNGDKVWWYLPEEKVVNVYRLKDYYLQIKPIIDFLSGLGKLDKDFSVRLDKNLPEEAPFYQLILKPKTPQPDLQQIQVRVSKTTFLPMEFSFDNLMGDGTRFRFSRMQTGVSLTGSFFEFIPPKGTQVVSQSPVLPPKK
ncbi:MAG: outer membrane lipoprotein carrier protein LolA [Deltaproteobacteria bacterium]|nr:outer membrane lipoprotein carrier protein LolA [Deltaproteobacteria bacterium]